MVTSLEGYFTVWLLWKLDIRWMSLRIGWQASEGRKGEWRIRIGMLHASELQA
jgi:hypothetical protein